MVQQNLYIHLSNVNNMPIETQSFEVMHVGQECQKAGWEPSSSSHS